MNHFATPDFWYAYRQLPSDMREVADKNFDLLRQDPHHPSLRLKIIGSYWSARGRLALPGTGARPCGGLGLVLDRPPQQIRATAEGLTEIWSLLNRHHDALEILTT